MEHSFNLQKTHAMQFLYYHNQAHCTSALPPDIITDVITYLTEGHETGLITNWGRLIAYHMSNRQPSRQTIAS